MTSVTISSISDCIAAHNPELIPNSGSGEAAVSLILTDGDSGAEILFIERSTRKDDPWSGQMALPGGKREPEDKNLMLTAQRETFEEIGLHIGAEHHIGRLDDITAPKGSPAHGLIVSCHVFQLPSPKLTSPNQEVKDTVWIPVGTLVDSGHFIPDFRPANYRGQFPGIRVSKTDPRVIWGLTYRILCGFFSVCRLNNPA